MCGCKKKKVTSGVSAVSVDPMQTVRVMVEQDAYYRSTVLNVPVILTSQKENLVFLQDIPVLKEKGIVYEVSA